MGRLCLLLRPAEFHPRLRKEKSANLAMRQRCEENLTLSADEAVILLLQDVIL